MITVKFLGRDTLAQDIPYRPGLVLAELLAATGVKEGSYMAVIVNGKLAVDFDQEVVDGSTVLVVPPLYGG